MCCFYMGIAQIALDPPPPSVKRANVEEKVLQTIWQALTPLGKRGKKVLQTWQAIMLPQIPINGNNVFQKGTSFFCIQLSLSVLVKHP